MVKLTSGLTVVLMLAAGSAAAAPPGLTPDEPPPRPPPQTDSSWWKPLSLLAGGVVLVGGGFVAQWQANQDLDEFEAEVEDRCAGGCTEEDIAPIRYLEDAAIFKNRCAIGMWVVGGAAIVGGIVWGLLDRPRRVQVVPVAHGDGVGAVLLGRF